MPNSADFLEELNPIQQQAVKATDGPVLILAGAGSGKTRVLTYRVAYLMTDKKVAPEQILMLTFTNKAAQEMRDRIIHLIGKTKQPIMGTFHSICARILRKEGYHLNLSIGFSIYDETDAIDAIKEAFANLKLDTKKTSPAAVRSIISGAKNENISETEYPQYARGYFQEIAAKVYLEYQKILRRNHALDFDDLLMYCLRLFLRSPETLHKYQEQFHYILVDEYQDTNPTQYLFIKMLAQRYRNLCVVGDASQCLLPGTQILTPQGNVAIEQIKEGNLVIAAAGRGNTHIVPVQKIKVSKFRGKIFVVKTKSGKILRATSNHILFARLNLRTNYYYVYLMFRKDKGYRIGLAKAFRTISNGHSEIGLLVRSNQKRADKMWILRVCKDRAEASYWEHWFVVNYGIPSMVFSTGGRSMKLNQKQIDDLYNSINTSERVKRLFTEQFIFEEYPHHHPKGVASRISPDRQLVHMTLFSDKRLSKKSPWCGHRISINTSNKTIEEMLKQQGHYTHTGNRNTWRIETSSWSYENALALAEKIAKDGGDLTINHSAFIVDDKKFLFTPVSHLRESMEIGILEQKKVVLDEIESVDIEDYTGEVYDLDVETLHNYSANGIVVHNSIYSFRGADFRNIVNFQNDYKETKVFNLEQNYRSTQVILDAAHAVVSANKSHPILSLWTDKTSGDKIVLFQGRTEVDEAQFVIDEMKKSNRPFSDFAVLYRTNAQSRSLEEQLLKEGVPYTLIGGLKFYERKEIKDVLAYLRLVANPNDSISRKRIEKIGIKRAMRFDLLQNSLKDTKNELTTLELLNQILEATSYLETIDDGTEAGSVRVENVKELKSVAEEFPQLIQFLENVALVQDTTMPDSKNGPQITNAVTLMTIHASKGLEFPVVFLVGMEEGLFPHSRAMLDPNQMEEERRLAYVGITRAKDKLYMLYTKSRLYFGTRSNNLVSRFLSAIPEKLLDQSQTYRESKDYSVDDDIYDTKDDDWV